MRCLWLWSVLGAMGVPACSSPPDSQPAKAKAEAPPEPLEVDARYAAFTFGHTLTLFRPEGAELVPIIEMGDATKRTMKAVVALHQAGELSVGLWTFTQLEDDTLAPAEGPTPLLPLTKDGATHPDAVDALRVQMTAPRSVVTRPQGIKTESAVDAVEVMRNAAVTIRDVRGTAKARVEALALFARGLDDQHLFASHGLARALDSLSAAGSFVPVASASKRRASVDGPEGIRLTLLDKSEGWVLEDIGRTPAPANAPE